MWLLFQHTPPLPSLPLHRLSGSSARPCFPGPVFPRSKAVEVLNQGSGVAACTQRLVAVGSTPLGAAPARVRTSLASPDPSLELLPRVGQGGARWPARPLPPLLPRRRRLAPGGPERGVGPQPCPACCARNALLTCAPAPSRMPAGLGGGDGGQLASSPLGTGPARGEPGWRRSRPPPAPPAARSPTTCDCPTCREPHLKGMMQYAAAATCRRALLYVAAGWDALVCAAVGSSAGMTGVGITGCN